LYWDAKTGFRGNPDVTYDVVILGAGPAGLSAALALGRARRRVLLCDAGVRRNAAAEQVHNFVTRDGTPPMEFRRIGREQLGRYANVELREVGVEQIHGEKGAFQVHFATEMFAARRVLLCTGMLDESVEIDGFSELWGASIFQCPYCHGWEVQDQAFGVFAHSVEMLEFAVLLRGWTRSVVAFTDGKYVVPLETAARLSKAGVGLDDRRIARLVARDSKLNQVEFVEGPSLPLDVLFARPAQRQVPIVQSLGLFLNPMGYVTVDEFHRETSIPGVYAAGDLVTPMQAAIVAAASGTHAASMLNHGLVAELAAGGLLL
jgi:thioredoxin reductase